MFAQDDVGHTIAHACCMGPQPRPEILKYMLQQIESGVAHPSVGGLGLLQMIDVPAANGMLPIHYAAKHGYKEMIRILSEHGQVIDVSTLPAPGDAPLHFAARNGHCDLARELVRGIDFWVSCSTCHSFVI